MIRSPLLRALLYAPAKLYELGVRARIALYRSGVFKTHQLAAPVISVGNLSVGGTGKTPCVAFLAQLLCDAGHQVAILSRGYKRTSRGRIEVSDGQRILCSPDEAGDEPYLLAQSCRGVRVIADQDRVAAGRWLEAQTQISAFILDDAYQHLRLARTLNLLLLDATERLEDAAMVPFGRLREPLSELRRADAVIVTRSDQPFDRASFETIIRRYNDAPIFFAHHTMTSLRRLDNDTRVGLQTFVGQPVATLCCIARPERFFADITGLGMQIVVRQNFSDHHRYTSEEFLAVVADAQAARAVAIITTEKDAANLPPDAVRSAALPVYAAQIEFRCEAETELKTFVLQTVSSHHSR